jgi:splicing factor 1
MSWRNQGITGSNNIPLGNRRRFGGEPESDGTPDRDLKRGRDPEPRSDADGPRRRKKRNRWGEASENKAAGLMGLPTAILSSMTSEQLEAYTLHLRIEEISQKLRIDDVVPADGDRSPSPPPQYDNHGRRINTREYRYRKRLEDERHKLIERAMKTIPNYHPPQDYRRPTKTQEKVYVPVNDYPEINFSMIANPDPNRTSYCLPSPLLEFDHSHYSPCFEETGPTSEWALPLPHSNVKKTLTLTLSFLAKLDYLSDLAVTHSRRWRMTQAPKSPFVERAPSRRARVALTPLTPATRRRISTA